MFKSQIKIFKSFPLVVILLIAFFPSIPVGAAGEIITSTETGGAWGAPSTWIGGIVPDGVDDSVVIATTNGDSVILSGSTVVKGSLTINSGAELTTGNYALTLEGDFVNNGLFDGGASNITIAGSALTQSIAGFSTTGTVQFTKSTGVGTFTGNVNAGAMTLNDSGGTLNLGVGRYHVITGNLSRLAGMLEGSSSTIRINGNASGLTGSFDPGTGTFLYGGSIQDVSGGTYNRLKFQGTGAKTVQGNITVNENLIITSGSNLSIGGFNLGISGTTSITGLLTFTSPVGTKTFNGLVTINPGGVWKNDGTGNANVHFHSGLTHNGGPNNFFGGTGIYHFDTADQWIAGSSPITMPNLMVETGRVLTNNNSGGLRVTASLKGDTLVQGATGYLGIGVSDGNFTLTALDATAVGNTVDYNYAGSQVVRNIPYHHLTLSSSGVKTLGSGLTHVNGNLRLSGTASLTTGADLDVDGNLVIDSGASLTVGAFNFNVDGAATITGSSSSVNGKLTFSSSTGTRTMGGLVSVGTNGVWDNSANTPVLFAGGLSFGGKTFTAGTGANTFQLNPSQSIGGTAAFTIPYLVIDAGVNLTNNNSAGLTVSSMLSGSGTLTQGAGGVLLLGMPSANLTLANLVADAAGNLVNYSGTVQSVKPVTYHHLTLSGSDSKDLSGLTTINGDLTVSSTASAATAAPLVIGGNLRIGGVPGSGTSFTVSGYDFTVMGTTTVYGTLNFTDAAGTKLFTGLVTEFGTWLNSGNSNIIFRGGLTVNDNSYSAFTAGNGVYSFQSTPSQAIGGSKSITIPNLTVDSGVTLTNNGTITVSTALSGAGSWIQASTAVLNLGGAADIAALDAAAAGNIVRYTGASAQTVIATPYHHLDLTGGSVKTLLPGFTTVNGNLVINTSGTSVTLADNLVIGGSLNIAAGTLDVSASNYALTVKGNWTGTGTFIPQQGTVTLLGTSQQTLSNNSSSPYYNLVLNNPAGVNFSSTKDAYVNGLLTLTNGRITTGARVLILGSTASIIGENSTNHVVGNVRKNFSSPTSSQTFTFPVGDGIYYAPIAITINNVSAPGSLTAKTTPGEHPNIATVIGINQNVDVNRSWTLTPSLSFVFSTYDATFSFVPEDLDPGADTGVFAVKRYDSSPAGWYPTTTGIRSSTSIQATGIPYTSSTNIYSFAVGEGDDIPPAITNITSTTPDGYYNAGDVISGISVTFSEVVYVTEFPQLTLDTGGVIIYSSGSGTNTLSFSDYSVAAGQNSPDLDANSLGLNGGTIKDICNNPASLTFSGTSLAANKSIVVDTAEPQSQVDSMPSNPTNNTIAVFTVSASEDSTFECQVDGGDYAVCPGSFNMTEGQHTFYVRATDLAGNLETTPASYTWVIDLTPPVMTGITSTTLDGYYKAGDVISGIAVTFSDVVNVTGTPQLTLETGSVDAVLDYLSGSGTNTLIFSDYTVLAGDASPDLDVVSLSLNGGAIRDISTNDASLTLPGASLAANKAIVIDTESPQILSSVRLDTDSTAYVTRNFLVTFSEPVQGLGPEDFSLAVNGITGASVSSVSGSGASYTVSINTGLGNGTIQLQLLTDGGITDLALNPLSVPFTTGEFYTVNKTLILKSLNTYDGWVLESTPTSSVGGTMNSTATTFYLGDDSAKKQYRGLLHFQTSLLPDVNVEILSVTLKIKKAGGTGNTSTLGPLLADMTKPSFGGAALALTDFQAAAGKPNIFNPFTVASGWYTSIMKPEGLSYVNLLGATQIRLRFTKGDDGDAWADYLLFYSGNAVTDSRPQLIIVYQIH